MNDDKRLSKLYQQSCTEIPSEFSDVLIKKQAAITVQQYRHRHWIKNASIAASIMVTVGISLRVLIPSDMNEAEFAPELEESRVILDSAPVPVIRPQSTASMSFDAGTAENRNLQRKKALNKQTSEMDKKQDCKKMPETEKQPAASSGCADKDNQVLEPE